VGGRFTIQIAFVPDKLDWFIQSSLGWCNL
jgi:hypothetical protein